MTRSPETALFISPVSPDPNGKGFEMRAYWTLRAVASRRETTLLLAPLSPNDPCRPSPEAQKLAAETIISPPPRTPRLAPFMFAALRAAPLPVWPNAADRALRFFNAPPEHRTLTRARLRTVAELVAGRRFDHLHLFRLFTAPIAFAARDAIAAGDSGALRMSLDVDDVESVAHTRVAKVHSGRGDARRAALARRTAEIFKADEDRFFPEFDHLALCSAADAEAVRARLSDLGANATVGVAPNVVASPTTIAPAPKDDVFRLLFVGALHYFPNIDGLRFFLEDVADKLDARLGAERWTLDVVGRGGRDATPAALADHPRLRLIEEAPSMPPAYARAHAVIAPIRAGGGTRIKILEAFAQGRPVVSTTLGAEGIDAEDGAHLLLADAPEAFAEACARLAEDADLRERLTRAGRALVAERYGPDAIVDGLLGEPHENLAAEPA